MKATSIITTLRARVAMTLLLAITTFTSAWATEFITDVMLIGGTQSETETLLKKYKKEGWQPYDQDLNAGCGSSSDYIYLLYKAADNYTTANLTFITNFYISTSSGTAPDDVRYNNHDYHLVPFDGGDHFKSKKGDLNSNCGSSSDDIHLYYIKDIVNLNYQAVSSIVFNNTQSGAVGKNGGTTGYNLNAGTSGNKIYLHITQERAHWWKIQKTSDGGKCRLIDYDSDVDKSKVKAVPAIIEGATVVDIYPDIDFTMFENLETFYFSNSTEVSTMPSVAGCSNFLQVNTIDDNGNVKEYELPPSITSLPDKAFQNTKLIDIKMPNVTSVGKNAFEGCSSLPVTDNIRYADTYIIEAIDRSKSQYTIKAGTRFIREYAFKDCKNITSIKIPNTVTFIGEYTFHSCSNLTSIEISDFLSDIKEYTFYGCSKLDSVTIPNSVTSIGNRSFYNCSSMSRVSIGNSVESIGDSAFYNCSSLTSVTIPDRVTSIGKDAFKGCKGLTSVSIGNSVTSIGNYAFFDCSNLTTVIIGNSVTSIGQSAFQYCSSLTSVSIGNSVTSIGQDAFYGCKGLTSVTIPNSVTSIGQGAFYGCSGLKSVIIGNGVTSIGESAFKGGSSLTSVIIPNSVTSIGNSAFQYCKGLTSVTIPNSVTSIGEAAFQDCKGLTSVTIGNSVTSIGEYAFLGCSSLDSVTINSDAIMSKTYSYFSSLKDIFDNYVKKYTIGDGVTAIGQYAFYQCTSVESVTIGKDVKNIGYAAFYGCSSLTDIYFDGMETQWGQVSKGQYWKPDATKVHWRCTVTFNANGYGTAPAAQTGLWSSESKATEPVAPTASGVVFTGWYTNAACTTKWDFSTPVPGDMTLYAGWENLLLLADNTANDIAPYNGQKCSVTLSGRTLYKDGTWNTLCLPFAVTDGDATDDISFSGTPLEGAVVKILDSSSSAKSTLTLNFSSATSITAGTPCIVRWEKTDNNAGNNDHNLYEPTFNGVIINNELHPVDQAAVDFTGSFSPVSLAAGDRSVLYLDANNSLFYPNTAMTIGSCRACFQLADGLFNFDLGDVNGDGIITVTDVMMLVNSILGHVNNNFITANADVNNDNNITVTDVMVLVNNILNGKSTFKVVTNIDDFPIKFGGGGKNPARVGKNQIWR